MTIAANIRSIQSLFRQFNAASSPELTTVSGPHQSIVYEATAARLAKKDLVEKANGLPRWSAFAEQHMVKHASQLHVGLGWALAETETTDLSFINQFEAQWIWRVFDGYGYYNGLFNRRDTIRHQHVPGCIPEEYRNAFDQGFGRSFWYLSQGDSERLERLLEHFPEERRHNLWRGIGVAALYVGGISDEQLTQLNEDSGQFKPAFQCGLLLALGSLEKAGVDTQSAIASCRQLGLNTKDSEQLCNSTKAFESHLHSFENAL